MRGYEKRVIALAQRSDLLVRYRRNLRHEVAGSRFVDTAGFAKAFAAALESELADRDRIASSDT